VSRSSPPRAVVVAAAAAAVAAAGAAPRTATCTADPSAHTGPGARGGRRPEYSKYWRSRRASLRVVVCVLVDLYPRRIARCSSLRREDSAHFWRHGLLHVSTSALLCRALLCHLQLLHAQLWWWHCRLVSRWECVPWWWPLSCSMLGLG
jgi:hypothetical protein